MKKFKIHPKVWQAAEDAIADKNNYLVHWPNRAETWWKRIPKIIYWKFKVFRGYKAGPHAPRVIRNIKSKKVWVQCPYCGKYLHEIVSSPPEYKFCPHCGHQYAVADVDNSREETVIRINEDELGHLLFDGKGGAYLTKKMSRDLKIKTDKDGKILSGQ